MDFVEWCDQVLNNLSRALAEPPDRTAISEQELAALIYSEVFIARYEFWDSSYVKGLKAAIRELKRVKLIEVPPGMGDLYAVTAAGHEYLKNKEVLWQEIRRVPLDSEQEQLLYVTNSLSQHRADDHAWLEDVPHEPVLSSLNWQIEQLWEVSKKLEQHDLAHRQALMGPRVILRSKYRGLIWEKLHPASRESFAASNTGVQAAQNLPHAPHGRVDAVSAIDAAGKRYLRIFLCHSSGDKLAVRDLYGRLRSAANYISPWLDEEDLLPGQRWQEEIPKAVRESDVVIVCLSQNAVNKRGYVQKEIKYALDVADEQPEGTIFLIPVRLEDCEIPERLEHLHCVNLNQSRGFEQLIRALNVRAEKLGIVGGASSVEHDLIDEKSEQARVTQLRQELLASYPGDREKAARQLGRLGPIASSAVPTLIKKLKDPSGAVRDAAAWALREIGTTQALDAVDRYENK